MLTRIQATAAVLLTLGGLAAAERKTQIPAGLQRAVESARHEVHSVGAAHQAYNPKQNFEILFQDGAAAVKGDDGEVRVQLAAWGRTGQMQTPQAPVVKAEGNRLEYSRGAMTEWYVNDARGLEQGFTLSTRPAGDGPLRVTLAFTGTVEPKLESPSSVTLHRNGEVALRYGGLKAWDASGRTLASHMEVEGGDVRLVVDDAEARYPLTIDPLLQRAKLTAPDGESLDGFGWSLSVDGDTAVIGAPHSSSNTGSAYVFVRSGGVWTLQQKITAADGAASDLFGTCVAVHGDTATIGASGDDGTTGSSGSVYVFVRSAGAWTLQQKLTADMERFGISVSVNGDTAVIGAGGPVIMGFAGPGGAYVFVRNAGAWTQQQKLLIPGKGVQQFGNSVSVEGNTALIGSLGEAAYVFVRSSGVWTLQQTLTEPAANGFGYSVSLSGETAMIGAIASNTAYAFVRNAGIWTEQQALTPSEVTAGAVFGWSVSIAGDTAVIGANKDSSFRGSAFVFVRSGSVWTQVQKLTASDGSASDQFGYSVAASGDTVLIGAAHDDVTKGSAYVFTLPVVTISSNYPGRSAALSGTGCPAGNATLPITLKSFFGCTVGFASGPSQTALGERYTFQAWHDGVTANPRTLPVPQQDITYTANFTAEYELTTTANPPSGGSVTGAGWYPASTNATAVALPTAGYLFNGFAGNLSGITTPQQLLMSGPRDVTGNFLPTPPANLSVAITGKSGAASSRLWTITLNNSGPGTAYGAQIHGIQLTQTFGTSCVPLRVSPAAFPLSGGNLAPGGSTILGVTFNFAGCPDTARFTAALTFTANSGSSVGLTTLANQLR